MANMVQVSPNRMELSRLRKRLKSAQRGHKLLKDKQEALIKNFMLKVRRVMELRKEAEEELLLCYRSFQMARAQTLPSMIEQSLLLAGGETSVEVEYSNVVGVRIPTYRLPVQVMRLRYGLASSPGNLDVALERFSIALQKLIELAAEEKGLKLMAAEIERTRRRVNALEYMLIPSITETIRTINTKLADNELSALSRLMIIKDIVRAH